MAKHTYLIQPKRTLSLDIINDRIEHIRCILGFPVPNFAKKLTKEEGVVKNILSGKTLPEVKFLENLLTVFPIINEQFLYVGSGNEFRGKNYSPYCYVKGANDVTDMGVVRRFTQIREGHRLSYAGMAKRIGSTKDVVYNIENFDSAMKVALALRVIDEFNVPLEWFFRGTGVPPQFGRRRSIKEIQNM